MKQKNLKIVKGKRTIQSAFVNLAECTEKYLNDYNLLDIEALEILADLYVQQ